MLKTLRRRHARNLATSNREWMNDRLDAIARLVDEIRAVPEGASAQELTEQLLSLADDAHFRAFYIDKYAAKAARTWTCFFCQATNGDTERCTACGV